MRLDWYESHWPVRLFTPTSTPCQRVICAYDERWLVGGGIARYGHEIIERLQDRVDFVPLRIRAPIRDPFNPLSLASALRHNAADLFWSPGFMAPLRS